MPKITIQLISKDGSLFGDLIRIESVSVPRVGELIDAQAFLSLPAGEVGDFMVCSVIHKLTEFGFAPHITALQWYKGIRADLLRKRGWLPPDGNSEGLSYDEDDLRPD